MAKPTKNKKASAAKSPSRKKTSAQGAAARKTESKKTVKSSGAKSTKSHVPETIRLLGTNHRERRLDPFVKQQKEKLLQLRDAMVDSMAGVAQDTLMPARTHTIAILR
jgi:hypothetical protein